MARTSLSYSMEKHLRKLAEDKLIGKQKCSLVPTEVYTHTCYGEDLNVLDAPRRWLYTEGLANGMSTEQARIFANKHVLYVNPAELEAEYEHLLHSEAVVTA